MEEIFATNMFAIFEQFKIECGFTAEVIIDQADAMCNTDSDYMKFLHKINKVLYTACNHNDQADLAMYFGYPNKAAVIEWMHA